MKHTGWQLTAAVLLLVVAPALAQSPSPPPPFETIQKRVDEVNLTLTVTDGRGRFVAGLTEQNFAILDDRQPPVSVNRFQSLTDMPLRLCVVIDASDSISNYVAFQRQVAIGFLQRVLRPGIDQACLIKFTERPELVQGFTDDIKKLEASARSLKAQGSTAVWDALQFTSETMARGSSTAEVRRAVVLITDGDDNSSYATLEQAVQSVLRAEITVHVVDTIPSLDTSLRAMKRLAAATGGHVWQGGNPKQLSAALAKIEQSLRSGYFVAYRPAGELKPGLFRKIQVKMRGHRGRIAYRSGYYVPQVE